MFRDHIYEVKPISFDETDSKLFENEMTLKVEFPFTVTIEVLKKLIKTTDNNYLFNTLYI